MFCESQIHLIEESELGYRTMEWFGGQREIASKAYGFEILPVTLNLSLSTNFGKHSIPSQCAIHYSEFTSAR